MRRYEDTNARTTCQSEKYFFMIFTDESFHGHGLFEVVHELFVEKTKLLWTHYFSICTDEFLSKHRLFEDVHGLFVKKFVLKKPHDKKCWRERI